MKDSGGGGRTKDNGPDGGAGGGGDGRRVTAERIGTARLALTPLTVRDAAEMVEVLAGEDLYVFIGGAPPGLDDLRSRYARLVAGRSPDGGQDWLNWIVRREGDGRAVGTVQATVTGAGRRAEIAWVVGTAWQGRGYASESAAAMAGWLRAQGVTVLQAHIHPGHEASMKVAARIGLRPTGLVEDGERVWLWERT
ncbi:acetyltransferase [Sphaerisporangium krabiense]|uniref:RimJ/RimL family protein N-acetyltransferase n=1 Tax=Sphaerisporangium krabiense TaxID=763782 RepID=A0A7W8Z999_9ACTN|nr:GNAT family N-acetyltransferase [Sphaerisporangium krabiense]MBB5629700.1 RimJ/RimL family protein N-acetyltransferase [Sphaerisporangium krabiense]GII63799.1 acetyltransferase [Sphaerisporangium krabiense]